MALNNVPLSGQNLNETRDAIRQNFKTYIDTQFAVDHQEFATVGAGWHKKLTVPAPADSTIPTPPASGWVVFPAIPDTAFNTASSTYPLTLATQELNLKKEGSIPVIPLTASLQAGIGWAYLPSGILIKWGEEFNVSPGATRDIPFTLSANIPVFSSVFNVQYNARFQASGNTFTSNPGTEIGTLTAAKFTLRIAAASGGQLNVKWLAIGV